ncbi:head-tail connector protein [Streptomyces spectabilis]|uniref:head-tail connector protein n=1 Tax=Streptomyces spectabilis TaxID=68270 RepID=UPI0033E5F0DF
MPYDLGDVVPLRTTIKDDAGGLANAGTMVLSIGLPDATTVTVSPVAPVSTGTYAYGYLSVQAGRHTVRWLATGANAGAYTDVFDVREPVSPALFSLADAKQYLNKTTTGDDDEIRAMVEAVTAAVEGYVGAVIVRTVTEDHDVRVARTISLRKTPALALTSATAVLTGAASYDVDGLDLDPSGGIVRRKDGGLLHGPLRFVYTAGRRIVPAAITLGGKIILQHMWRTQQGPGRPQMGVGDFEVTEPVPGLGYAVPNRALQILEPYKLPPGVA